MNLSFGRGQKCCTYVDINGHQFWMGTKGQWCLLVVFSLGGEAVQILAHHKAISQLSGSVTSVGTSLTWETRSYTEMQGQACGNASGLLCSSGALQMVAIHPNSENRCPNSEGCPILSFTALWWISPFLNTTMTYLLSCLENPQRDSKPILAPNTLKSLFEPDESDSSAWKIFQCSSRWNGWALFLCPLSRSALCCPVLLLAWAPPQHLWLCGDFAALIENLFSFSFTIFVSFKCYTNDMIICNILSPQSVSDQWLEGCF